MIYFFEKKLLTRSLKTVIFSPCRPIELPALKRDILKKNLIEIWNREAVSTSNKTFFS